MDRNSKCVPFIAPKATATFAMKKLAVGDYDDFDEHQPQAPAGVLVAE